MSIQESTDPAREARLRRVARGQDLVMRKSRRRNPALWDYGVYWLVDPYNNGLVSSEYGMNLDEVEEFLADY